MKENFKISMPVCAKETKESFEPENPREPLDHSENLDFIKILAQEENVKEKITENMFYQHSHNTTTKPVCYYCIDLSNVKIRKIPSNLKEQAYSLYKETNEGKKYTVIDVDTDFWSNIFLKHLAKGIKEEEETGKPAVAKIPNGCCEHHDCPINLFYKALTIVCYQFNIESDE